MESDNTPLRNPANLSVLDYVGELSAHSDVAEALTSAVSRLGDIRLYCPDSAAYRYVLASTQRVIFALAVGMNTVAFRLDEALRRRALETGGRALPEAGPEWVSFTLFRNDWPDVDLPFWALKAYGFARNSGP